MRRIVLLLLCLASILFSNAQTPVNDEYTGALEVIPSTNASCSSLTSGSTLNATESMPGCFGSAEDDIWFKFTATSNRHRIIVAGDNINHVLELFNLSSGNLISIGCRYLTYPSSYGGLTAEFNNLIAGITYYYRVYGAGSSSQQGQIRSCIISPPPPPSNDECTGAINLPVNIDDNCTSVYSGVFGYASQSLPAFINNGYDAFDVWFKFTATAASHRIRFTYDDNVTTPLIQAFSGDCNNLVSFAYITPPIQYQNQPMVGMLSNLTPGNTYYIRVYNDGSVSRPNETIGLCISSPQGASGYQFPSISFTSPANGSVFTAPTSINLLTSVLEGEEPIQKVEFFYREAQHSDTKLGEDLTASYEYLWNDVPPGQYIVTAKVTDLIGATAISTTNITVNTQPTNQLPTVSINAYAVGSHFAPATIFLNINAQDIDGTIVKVEIYQNGLLLFEVPPYNSNFAISNVSSGVYQYQAKAIDNQGGVGFSNMVPVGILESLKVDLTAPASGATFTAPATISLEATPSGGDGTFSKVEFFNGTTRLGEDLTAPYIFNWNNVATGTYMLKAKVTHSSGDTAISTAVSITVTDPVNQLPTISLTSPPSGATFTAPAFINITATAADADGTISKVEFYNGTTKLGDDLTAPYQYSWSGVSAGSYSLSAKAIDNLGDAAFSIAISITVNELPTISLTSPASGATFTAPASINITATAADADGTISKVEFYNGTTKLGEALTAPYQYSWSGVSAGSYSLSAKAIDNLGGSTSSTAVSIIVNVLPTVSLTAPVNRATFTAPASINIAATAADVDGTISKVEFYNGAIKIGEDITAPYQYIWSGVSAGTYSLTAKAIDNLGGAASSTAVSITVNELPTVNLTSPVNGATFTAPASINIAATAADADGTISKVEFYNGAIKIGEDLTAPYQYIWSGVSAGIYSLTAKAIDNLGAIGSSTTISISVTTPLPISDFFVTKNSVWKYNDKGVDLGTTWTALNYNDATWSSGAGVLGYGMPVTTTLSYGNKNSKYPSYYFRRTFEIADASLYTTLIFNIRKDDGAVVYLNGIEQFRTNMPGGTVVYNSLASSDLNGSDQTTYLSFTIPASQLKTGSNVIAVSVHQSDRRSSDMNFDMEVIGTSIVNVLPTVSLTAPVNGATFTAPASINIAATAADVDGTISKVEFYNGAIKIGEDITAPYQYIWSGVSAGTYSLTAKAIDNLGGVASSTAVSITVNELPTVNLTSPVNGATFTAPASINIAATAADADGTISKVEFYNGAIKIGEDLTAPYQYIWSGVSAGTYSLTAKAIDNLGAIGSSTTISISVTTPLPISDFFVTKNSVWKYNDKGVDLGTTWTALNYNDATWSSGAGVLGYGMPVTTTLNYGNKNSKYPSYYFRRSFEIADASLYTTLIFNIRRDDGAVVYLNGIEQFRTNMPGGTVGYNSLASSDLNGSDQTTYFNFRIPASQLKNGTNVIAVSVHQSDRRSSDISFDMEVIGETAINQSANARINISDATSSNEILSIDGKDRLSIKALPNPGTSYFTLILQSSRLETINIKVIDVMGRVIETRRKLPANESIRLGYNYRPGIYFVEAIQGTQRITLKLIKGTD